MIKPTMNDLEIMARTIYGEARGLNQQGKFEVGCVIMNRVKAQSWYGETIASVCKKPYQFSCWNDNDVNRIKLLNTDVFSKHFRDCLRAAIDAIDGPDITFGATHYHTINVKPKWAEGKNPCFKGGYHVYYNNID